MIRRRSTPWIHRWSRPIIGAISLVGALLTGYLTTVKLSGAEVAGCTANSAQAIGSCDAVLSSPYATVFGLPLALFGLLAYLSMGIFAMAPLAINGDQQKELRSNLERWTQLLLFAGATAMTVFSGYLMYVLAFQIKAVCFYCIGSAIFSLSLLGLTLFGNTWEDIGQILFTGLIIVMVTLIGTLGVYANIASPGATGRTLVSLPTTPPAPGKGWEITTTSGAAEIALAEHLAASGAKEYGAYWCPHCFQQKELFGKEAFAKVPYVECAPDGVNAQTQACQAAGVKAFPTWVINGEIHSGVRSLEKLAELSGYTGDRNFKYTTSLGN
jgi:uncharacterized membrane protein/glutaredoxin